VDAPAPVSARRRAFVWSGLAFSLLGSIAILLLARRREAEELRPLIVGAALRHGLDPDLVTAVVEAESSGNTRAVSRAQAYGLMQVRIPTARDMAGRDVRVEELFDPVVNLDLGCRYLRRMLDRYGDLRLALMAYNAGPGKVDAWRAQEPDPAKVLYRVAFGETRAYVLRILDRVSELK
jgi:soluble lytic murein transglycosylase-like protein